MIFAFFAFLWGSKYVKSVISGQNLTFRTKNLHFIAENRCFLRFFGPHRAYPDFTVNLELVSGKWLNW